MSKEEFLKELDLHLQGLPSDDRKERILFYEEMIIDRVEEGKTEEEAINELGGIEKVVGDIANETPLVTLVKEKVKPKRQLKAWEIILIILGFPLWFPLVLVFVLLCLLLYLLIWVGVIVVYAIEVGFGAGAVGSLILFFANLGGGEFSITYFGSFFMMIGAAILFIFACYGVTLGTIKLSKLTIRNIKSAFLKKGETK